MTATARRIVVTRPIPAAGLRILDEAAMGRATVLQPDPDAHVDPLALRNAVAGADALLCLLTERIDRPLLESCPLLRGVANMAVGYNNIDVAAATSLGIPVSNTPGVLTETTADLAWALILAVARRITEADAYMRAERYRIWGPELLLGADVGTGPDGERKTLGIIGFGRIGQAVARRARGFDMRVLAWNPHSRDVIEAADDVEYASVEDILERSDFVSLHAAYTPDTHHLIDAAALQRMKPTSFLINTARGEMVDEAALVRALREGRIAGAGLDVFEREPAMSDGLAACPNAVLLPHIGSASDATRGRMASMAAANTVAHMRLERAPNVVNLDVYETDAYRERMKRVRDD
ncbi:MAG TPA: D-glycerate dehydrogenase [Longimicrobiales bacterium]|nr:D-glycerate dehydrogenase [Longimicrobiales bacterium]